MSNEPVVNFHFSVDFSDMIGGFSEISGLKAKHEILEYRSGADPTYSPIKIPGLKKYSNIVLKRGALKDDNTSFSWFNNIGLIVEKRDITIKLLNHQHEPSIVWKVKNAWPIEINFSELNALKSEILIETLELAHEGFIMERLGN
ncbi:phage tail protein [Algibacter amylolyticus]|uniref:Phage tail protein n=1 Tax=Algibacter amylolyticus TaxID=1608400 RepID=A0A5M7AVE5_9FLAO|nr:phage tail protein [Algibacter amylolyticus]KAA5821413.1 phage tail protein [Algibacter amylolyticus]MBB5268285.1 phage tail-like protein [Algibacter amylolyticus]TSJ72925.1 phage tail protein [Algibacter amylolyticus]